VLRFSHFLDDVKRNSERLYSCEVSTLPDSHHTNTAPTIMCLSSDLGSRRNHVVRGGVLLRTPLQRLIPIISPLSLNLLKHSELRFSHFLDDLKHNSERQYSCEVSTLFARLTPHEYSHPPLCLSSDLGASWNHVVRRWRVVKDATPTPNPNP